MNRTDLQALIQRMNELADQGERAERDDPPPEWPTLMRHGATALADLMTASEAEPTVATSHPAPWRTGRSWGVTLVSADDKLVGCMQTPELAARVVEAVNRANGGTDG